MSEVNPEDDSEQEVLVPAKELSPDELLTAARKAEYEDKKKLEKIKAKQKALDEKQFKVLKRVEKLRADHERQMKVLSLAQQKSKQRQDEIASREKKKQENAIMKKVSADDQKSKTAESYRQKSQQVRLQKKAQQDRVEEKRRNVELSRQQRYLNEEAISKRNQGYAELSRMNCIRRLQDRQASQALTAQLKAEKKRGEDGLLAEKLAEYIEGIHDFQRNIYSMELQEVEILKRLQKMQAAEKESVLELEYVLGGGNVTDFKPAPKSKAAVYSDSTGD